MDVGDAHDLIVKLVIATLLEDVSNDLGLGGMPLMALFSICCCDIGQALRRKDDILDNYPSAPRIRTRETSSRRRK